jgi:hypothetical protein
MSSGFASSVISALKAMPPFCFTRFRKIAISSAGTIDGVPPPK